jgi:hypothetical protein
LGLTPYLLEGIGRKTDAARFALILDPCSHVDAVTENVISVDDDVSDVDADAENNVGARTCTVPLRYLFLDRHGTGYGVHSAGELDQHAVTGGLDDATPEFRDGWIDDLAPQCFQSRKGANLISTH